MLEVAILTCLEAQLIIKNITQNELPTEVKVELIREVLNRSSCEDGNV